MLGKLNDIQISDLLTDQAIGKIACIDGEQHYIIPLTYSYDGNYIYGQTMEGMKLDILRRNSLVCFIVDKLTDLKNWQSVIALGRFEELKGIEAQKAREQLLFHAAPQLSGSTIHSFEQEETEQVHDNSNLKNVMYRIRINKITGWCWL